MLVSNTVQLKLQTMLAASPAVPAVPARLDVQRRRCTALPLASAPAVPSLRVASRARRLLQCAARRGEREAEPQPPPPPADEEFGDFFPGADSVRAWQALESETKMVIQLAAGFFAVPALLSLSLRAAVIDPMLYLLQADFQDFNLTQRQWKELTLEVDALERRFRYDARMGHAPPLSDAQLEERLREEGLRLEDGERQRCREAVGNTLSDSLGTGLLFTGFWLNRSRLRLLRKGLAARFLSLEVSTQAFLLLLAADVTVGYRASPSLSECSLSRGSDAFRLSCAQIRATDGSPLWRSWSRATTWTARRRQTTPSGSSSRWCRW